MGGTIDPIFGSVAPIFGVAMGGYLAGNRAKHHTLYHGALAAAGYVLLEGIGFVPTPFVPADNALVDTIAIIVSDAALLSVGALAGWLGRPRAPSSSADTDTGR